MNPRGRIVTTIAAALALAVLAVGYTLGARPDRPVVTGAQPGALNPAGRQLLVLTNGLLSLVAADQPAGPRTVTEQVCDRVHAGGETIACLRPVDAFVGTRLVVLDRELREQRTVALTGFPNRLRVSASGRMIAWTLFIDGHSYATSGFSTQAGILDSRTGEMVTSLEEFTVTRDGRAYRAVDLNFWGITFTADDNRFYATMSTGGHRYLVEGDFAARTVRTLADNVECPSLSPDGTRLAFKSAIDSDPAKGWRLSVLDLATMRVTPLAETRSVDDQAMWLDDSTVGYALQRGDGTNEVWSVPADGSGAPQLVVPEANSPSLMQR